MAVEMKFKVGICPICKITRTLYKYDNSEKYFCSYECYMYHKRLVCPKKE